jgi:hypothetical protein
VPRRPRNTVAPLRVEPGGHLWGDEFRDLGEGVRKIGILPEKVAQGGAAPARAAGGRGHRLGLEGALDVIQACAVCDLLEDAPDDPHRLLVHFVTVAGLVELEAKRDGRGSDEKALLRLLSPAPARALGYLEALALLWERRDECPGAVPVLVVHDEIVVECNEEDAEKVAAWLEKAMVDGMNAVVNASEPRVPIEVEISPPSKTWGD